MRVCARFDRPGVVTRCEHNGGDPVHDPLVVRCRTIRIGFGQRGRVHDVANEFGAAQGVGLEHRPRAGQSHVGFVGQDP